MKSEILLSFDEAAKRLRELSRLVKVGVSDEFRGVMDDVKGLLESAVGEYGKMVEEGCDELRNIIVSVEEMLESFLSTFMVKMMDVERFEGQVTPLSEIMREFLKRVEDGVRITIDAQMKLIGALQSDVMRRLDELMVQVKGLLEKHYGSHVKTVEELVRLLGEIIGKEIKEMRGFVEKQEADAGWLVEGVAVRIGGLLHSAGRKLTHLVAEGLRSERELAKLFLSKFDEFISKITVIAKELEELSKTRGTLFEKIPSKVKLAMEAWSREVSSMVVSLREVYDEMLRLQEEVARRVEEEIVGEVIKVLEEERERVQNAFIGIRREIEERLGVFPELFETKVTNEINSALLRSTRSCEDTTSNVLFFMSDKFNSLVKGVISSLSSYAKEVAELLNSYVRGAMESVKLVEYSVLVMRRKASMIMQEKAYEYDKEGESLKERMESWKGAKLLEVKMKVTGREESISRKVMGEVEGLAASLEEAGKKVKEDAEKVAYKIGEGAEVLENVWQCSLDVTPVYTGTWMIIGKDAVARQMASMIKRAKSSAILVLPQPNNEVLEAVKHVDEKVKVKVLVQVAVELPILRELALLNNVEVNWCSEPGFWGILVDNKEVLIAPIDKENPLVATVSVQEGAVKIYGEIIERFAAMVMAKRKEEQFMEEKRTEYI